jgi:SprT protein
MKHVPTEIKQRILNRIQDCLEVAGVQIKTSVNYSIEGVVAGRATLSTSVLSFNSDLLMENVDSFIHNTVAHEVAHLIVYKKYPYAKQFHGPEFRNVMRQLGASTATYHSYKVSKNRIMYKCSCRDDIPLSKQKHNKIVNGIGNFFCTICKSKIERNQS